MRLQADRPSARARERGAGSLHFMAYDGGDLARLIWGELSCMARAPEKAKLAYRRLAFIRELCGNLGGYD